MDIDYDQGSLLIAPEGEWSFALADQYVLITAPEYPVNSAYRIRQAEKEGDYVRLQLFPDLPWSSAEAMSRPSQKTISFPT